MPAPKLQNDAPVPFDARHEQFRVFLQSVEAGAGYRTAWEELLATIPADLALRAEWGSRESVGAAGLLAGVPKNANVLIVGSGLLGTAPALALLGMRVTIVDASPDRLRFAKLRFQHLQYPEPQCELVRGELLNIQAETFDFVVLPDAPAGLPCVVRGAKDNLHFWMREAFRILRPGGECLLLAANRFAYKRYTGLHGKFERHGATFLKNVFSNHNEEYTSFGYARALRNAGFAIVERYVPYVSHLDYHNLVNLTSGGWPRIELGPQERKNLLKSAGYGLGLFQWLAPSALLIGRKPGDATSNAAVRESLLNKIIRHYFSETKNTNTTFRIEHLLATRGNAAIALVTSEQEQLVFRVPLCPKEIRLGRIHNDLLPRLRGFSQNLKIPSARGSYQFESMSFFVETREAGINSSQHTGSPTRAKTYLQLAEQLALLKIQPIVENDEFIENVVVARARLVAGRMRDPKVAKDILQIADNCSALLRNHKIPAVVSHGDLRAKHCLVLNDGTLTSMLDWGTAREPNLPLFDLIHFIIHDRKQQFGETLDSVATRALHPRSFADHEEVAIARYCELLQIDEPVRRACELYYPIEVAATAFLNWDYDRPHWVEVNFGDTIRRAAKL